MDDRELKKLIEEETEGMEVPDPLKLENVQKMLEGRRGKQKSYHGSMIMAAACLAVMIGLTATGIYGAPPDKMTAPEQSQDMQGIADAEESEEELYQVTGIRTAKSYSEIYGYIKAEEEQQKSTEYYNEYVGVEETEGIDIVEDSDTAESATENGSSNVTSQEYSDTNTREQGIAEADIVKTDGKNLYILCGQEIQIVDISEDRMEAASVIRIGSAADTSIHELYVKDDRLVVLYDQAEYDEAEDLAYRTRYAVAETYDVSDAAEPVSVGKVTQSGFYQSMRASGDHVYLISDFYPETPVSEYEQNGYIPEVQGEMIACGDILLPDKEQGSRYTIVSAFSIKDPGEKTDTKAIFGNTGTSYVSGENIYIYEREYASGPEETTTTCIRKVAYKDGILTPVGQTKIEGYLKDPFCIDEYKGNLRLVVTVDTNSENVMPLSDTAEIAVENSSVQTTQEAQSSNRLYILDEDLNEISRIEGLAPGEIVYSARFMGDMGYFVTFRQTDPLFSADLSDPAAPKVIGALKIPGFSEYLHPYGDGLLLGIGYDIDETGVTNNGVKLSMFDNSDPSDVQEIGRYILEQTYSTEAAYDYKAVFIDVEKNMIGFSVYGEEDKYEIFSYDEEGFHVIFEKNLSGHAYISGVRAFYAKDKIYLVVGNTVESFRMDTFDKVDDIVL